MMVPLFSNDHIYVALQNDKILCRKPGSFDFEETDMRDVAELHFSYSSIALLFLTQDARDLYRKFVSTSRTLIAKIIKNYHHVMDQCPGQLSEALLADHIFGSFSNAPQNLPWTAGDDVDWWEAMNGSQHKYASIENGSPRNFSLLNATSPNIFSAAPFGSKPLVDFLMVEYVTRKIARYKVSNMLDVSRTVKLTMTFKDQVPTFDIPPEYSDCDQMMFRNPESLLIDEVHHLGDRWGPSVSRIWGEGQFTVEVEAQFTDSSEYPVWAHQVDQWPLVKERATRPMPVDVLVAQ